MKSQARRPALLRPLSFFSRRLCPPRRARTRPGPRGCVPSGRARPLASAFLFVRSRLLLGRLSARASSRRRVVPGSRSGSARPRALAAAAPLVARAVVGGAVAVAAFATPRVRPRAIRRDRRRRRRRRDRAPHARLAPLHAALRLLALLSSLLTLAVERGAPPRPPGPRARSPRRTRRSRRCDRPRRLELVAQPARKRRAVVARPAAAATATAATATAEAPHRGARATEEYRATKTRGRAQTRTKTNDKRGNEKTGGRRPSRRV